MESFWEFLKTGTAFAWNTDLDNLFMESKVKIISEIEKGVRIFDKDKPTCLKTDWSNWHRLLALSETLTLPRYQTFLLP